MSITEKERGPEVAFQCFFLVSGAAIAYWVDFGFTRLDSQVSWVGQHWELKRLYWNVKDSDR